MNFFIGVGAAHFGAYGWASTPCRSASSRLRRRFYETWFRVSPRGAHFSTGIMGIFALALTPGCESLDADDSFRELRVLLAHISGNPAHERLGYRHFRVLSSLYIRSALRWSAGSICVHSPVSASSALTMAHRWSTAPVLTYTTLWIHQKRHIITAVTRVIAGSISRSA